MIKTAMLFKQQLCQNVVKLIFLKTKRVFLYVFAKTLFWKFEIKNFELIKDF